MTGGTFIAILSAIAAIVGSYLTASATTDAKVNNVDTKVEVLQERQALQYTEVKTSLDRIEKKLDGISTTPANRTTHN